MSSVGDLSTECKLSVILEKRPKLIEQLALCLDREMRFIPNWRQLATNLDVDVNVIKRLGQYSDYSPTIRLFEFLEVIQPDLTIKQLQDALLEIRRNDLFSLLSTKAGCIDSEKVKDIITSRNIQAPSPTAGLLDEIALALDVTSLVLSSWSDLAIKLGVPRKTCWEFERRSTDDPTHNLLHYLITTCPEMKLKTLKDALDSMKRKDVLKILQEQNQGDDVFLKDVMAQKPELVETMAENLNREEVPGVKNWIHLASKLNVPDDVRQELGATEKKRKSPTKEVIQWVAVNLPEKTLSDVANALDRIQRNDAIQIISMQFPDTVESTLERLRCSPQDSFRVPDPTGHNLSTSDNWKEKISLPKEVADVREHSSHCGTLPDQIDLVGRNETCERIITALSSNKAVEIVAPPGYGKTSVVIEVAHRLINRGKFIAYVNPRGVTCVEELASDIIEALGFVPSEDTITEAIRRIRALKTKSTVLLIENIDNLLHLEAQVRKDECLRELTSKNYGIKMRGKFTKDGFLSFLKDIGKCPTIHLVLTSREFCNFRLSFPTELIDLEPLKDSDSATLFKRCDDRLDEGSINDLVRVCGGIPLIICTVRSIFRGENPESFTHRLTTCSPQTLSKLLSPDFQAREDRIDRCLQICFDRFSKENQKILVMFSTFPKGFTEEQFDACFKSSIGGDLQTFPICLKQSSLLNFDRNNCLYSLHPLIRDFFSSMPEHKEAKSVFLRHYSDLIVSLCKKFLSADKKSVINRYRSEKDNVREAMAWCGDDHPELGQTVREHCVAAFNDAAVFLAEMMRKEEFVSLFCKFVYRCQHDMHLLSACLTNIGVKIVLSCTCKPYICHGALYQAKSFLARAKEIQSELTDVNEATRAHCLSKLGFCCVREGRIEEGYEYFDEALALRTKREKKSDETQDKVMLGACYNDIAASQMVQRKHICAIQTRLCYVLPLYEQNLGEHPFTARTLHWIGNSYHALGDYDNAVKYIGKSVEMREQLLGYHQETVRSLLDLRVALFAKEDFPRGKMSPSSDPALLGLGETFNQNDETPAEDISPEEDIAPYHVLARGKKPLAAYQRALEEGEIIDRRVKVMLIGQDRTGKTNVGHALKGEKFDPEESSTDGVQMHEVLKDVGVQPWKSSILTKQTTTYQHKCAELISRNLLTGMNQELMTTPNETSTLEQDLPVHPQLNSSPEMEELKHATPSVPKEKFDEVKQIGPSPNHTPGEFEREASWENIVSIVDGKLLGKDSDGEEGIWPIIWDFAGQAVYRAIHPIFMSSEAIYLLVVDLSKNLFATAQCRVKENGREEVTIPAPDCNDTNFDHIMRWLDLVHSLRRSRQLPPVILVGTHVDLVVNPEQKLYDLKSTLCHNSKVLSDHIAIALSVDNTKAGTISPQGEDTGITKLREKVIKTANKLQQTKRKVPLKWLQVEDRVYNMAKKGTMYTKREQLRLKIVDEIGPLEKEDDYEHLLNFLHDRGTIVYHVQAEDPNGLIVLDPRWLIEVLCKIISVKTHEDEELSLFSLCQDLKGKGILHGELLDHALSAQKLSHIRESLLFTMEKFNLLCRFNDKDGKPAFLVPCMLTITPEEDLIRTEDEGYAPAYITFNTDYVPAGLFCRILVLLGKWAASKTSCDQQQFFSNAARFIIGDLTCLGLVCHKSVIKVHIWSMDSSNPVKMNTTLCEEAFRSLKRTLTFLKKECYWMRAVSWKFSGKCNLCLGKVDPKTKNCSRHDKKGCDSDDCAHYVAINSRPFCCENAKVLDQRLQRTWIQALPSKEANSVSTTHIIMGEALDSKRSRSINSHSFPSSSHCRGSDCALNVTLLAVEWGSSKGGFSTINRNLAINFAKHKRLNVTLFVPKGSCSDEEKKAARRHNVAVREASSPDGYEDGDWLTNPADDFAIDFVFGHGIYLGKQAKLIKRTHECKWIQVVHTAPEDLGMQRKGTDAISKGIKDNEIVVNLCRSADVVVTVGPKLKARYDSSLCVYKNDHDIIQLTPGIFSEFSDAKRISHKRSEFSVLIYGLIDPEDFSLKGYDLAAKAMAELKNDNYRLLVVGAPEEKLEQIANTFEDCGISRAKLTVRSIVKDRERIVALFCQADLLLMPSRTEAFGLTALEALSAGLPVLVSENSGFGQVLSTLTSGDQFVVKSNDPCEWARQIANVRRKDIKMRLDEVRALQKYYDARYSWERECSKLVAKMWNIFRDPVSNTLKDDAGKTIENELDSQMLLLQKTARSRGYEISDNEGSGNCMFHALSEQLSRVKRITMSSYKLRQAIVQYLRKNPRQPDGTCRFNFIEGWKSWDDYLQHMEQDGSWGDHLILLATANLFKTCIQVVSSLSHDHDVFITSNYCTDDRNPLVLGHVPELHYVSLVRRDANPSE